MIVTRTNHSASSLVAWSCTAHANALSEVYESTYTVGDKFKGELIERLARATFYKSAVFKNYRQKFIAVKVCDPSAEELISDECRQLFDVCHANEVEVVHTKTGVIFRVYPI